MSRPGTRCCVPATARSILGLVTSGLWRARAPASRRPTTLKFRACEASSRVDLDGRFCWQAGRPSSFHGARAGCGVLLKPQPSTVFADGKWHPAILQRIRRRGESVFGRGARLCAGVCRVLAILWCLSGSVGFTAAAATRISAVPTTTIGVRLVQCFLKLLGRSLSRGAFSSFGAGFVGTLSISECRWTSFLLTTVPTARR